MPSEKVTGERIINELINNLAAGAEPLHYSVLVPSVFNVYLPHEDYARLSVVFPQLKTEAMTALDEELRRCNRRAKANLLAAARNRLSAWLEPVGVNLSKQKAKTYSRSSDAGWQIAFNSWSRAEIENFLRQYEEAQAPDFVVVSQLDLPRENNNMAGNKTKLTLTMNRSGESQQVAESKPAPRLLVTTMPFNGRHDPLAQTLLTDLTDESATQPGPAKPKFEGLALIQYEENGVSQTFQMTKPNIKIGRGGEGYLVALTLHGSANISREHLRIRYDSASGKFFLQDLSAFGTTVNGNPVPGRIDNHNEGPEIELPRQARIGLASEIILDFEAL